MHRLLPAAALASCAALLTGPPGAPSAPVAVHEVAAASAGRALARWPVRRMAAAVSSAEETARGSARADERGAVRGGYGGGRAWTRGGLVARTTGKVFFSYHDRVFVCSGSTVRSANRDLVVTAAHCLRPDRRGWADDWVFVPGYDDGRAPYGEFAARRMLVPDAWSRRLDGDADIGMALLAPRAGRHAADVVGAQRIAFGGPLHRRTWLFGYPIAPASDGARLAYCSGRPARDPRGATTGRGVRCGMARGSSGGPWLTGFDPATGSGTVVSVTSFKFADDRTTLYAPRFGGTARALYARAQR